MEREKELIKKLKIATPEECGKILDKLFKQKIK